MEPRNRTQREPQSLDAWESWVDKLIVEAQERGDFDDLPGHGKPLQIEDSPFAGGLDVGFGILKNAGVAPYWVELEKEMRAAASALDEIAARAARAGSMHEPGVAPPAPKRARWPFRRRQHPASIPDRIPPARELASLKRAYLEQAAELDRLIAQYNAAIPRELWHLERPRVTQEGTGEAFDRLTTPPATPSSDEYP